MYYSHLFMLQSDFDKDVLVKFSQYLENLTVSELQKITVQGVVVTAGLSHRCATNLLMACAKNKILQIQYILCCPECGHKLKKFSSLEELPEESLQCYSCEANFIPTTENIEVYFSVTSPPDFNLGQQVLPVGPVAPMNSLHALLESGSGLNALLFDLTEEKYVHLLETCKNVRKNQKTTKETGDSLEKLLDELINCCALLRGSGIRTTTNQLDVYVRNKAYMPYGILSKIGCHFIVECKNEQKTPSGSYMSKMHSILEVINGKSKSISFGIIASRSDGPSTFRALSNKYYLAHDITIIAISLIEIETMLNARGNFLDLIERKIAEIHLDAISDLKKVGLYNS